jgi:hypothetical protein
MHYVGFNFLDVGNIITLFIVYQMTLLLVTSERNVSK